MVLAGVACGAKSGGGSGVGEPAGVIIGLSRISHNERVSYIMLDRLAYAR